MINNIYSNYSSRQNFGMLQSPGKEVTRYVEKKGLTGPLQNLKIAQSRNPFHNVRLYLQRGVGSKRLAAEFMPQFSDYKRVVMKEGHFKNPAEFLEQAARINNHPIS